MTAPQALFFDTFGTVVEWRTCVTKALITGAQQALDSGEDVSADVRDRASTMSEGEWLGLAEEWRLSYGKFTSTFDSSKEFVSVDQHHYSALQDLLSQRGILELFTDSELWSLTFAWHKLNPWADSVPGLDLLNKRFITSTLSNGNVTLLEDLKKHGSLPFTHLISAEDFGAYKPSPLVYNGAANLLGLESSQCAMVASHLKDLKAAKSCGFQTIYVERDLEEAWSADEVEQAKKDGFVDIWVDLNTGGFLEVARQLGLA
jgi:2-haloacid dehalogenase